MRLSVRQIVSENPYALKLKNSDIYINTENIEKSYSLIVVAKK
jgi:hypothetical protein